MSVEITLLFLEKRVEAAKLCASITEPFAIGGEPCPPELLFAKYQQVADELKSALAELRALNGGLDSNADLEEAEKRHIHSRVGTTAGEVSRAAQDFSAQLRFFEAMNPDQVANAKPVLETFDSIEKGTRDFTIPEDGPEEGSELSPEDNTEIPPDTKEDEIDPMLM